MASVGMTVQQMLCVASLATRALLAQLALPQLAQLALALMPQTLLAFPKNVQVAFLMFALLLIALKQLMDAVVAGLSLEMAEPCAQVVKQKRKMDAMAAKEVRMTVSVMMLACPRVRKSGAQVLLLSLLLGQD